MGDLQTTTLSLKAAYAFGAQRGLEKEVGEVREMVVEWDRSYTSSLRRGYIVELFERSGIFEDFKAKHWPVGNTREGESRRSRFLRIKKQYEDFLAGIGNADPAPNDAEEDEEQQFLAEADLRDFLAENLTCIEQGLRLYRDGERVGVEFPVEGGFIDILAVDRNDRLVVIELKLGRGRNKAIGQLLYYMGWVDKNIAKTPCRGLVIAKEIPPDLVLAIQRVPGVALCRYKLRVSVEPVASS